MEIRVNRFLRYLKQRTGASMNGRALAQTQVALDSASVTKPTP